VDKDEQLQVTLFRWMFGAKYGAGQQSRNDAYTALCEAAARTCDDAIANYDKEQLRTLIQQVRKEQGKRVCAYEESSHVSDEAAAELRENIERLRALGYDPEQMPAEDADRLLERLLMGYDLW
jgi:hypothetical protein